MTQTEYYWAWLAYAGGSAVFFAVFLWWTRRIPSLEVKVLLRTVIAVITVIPWRIDPDYDFLGPAWIISIADALLDGPQAFWRAGLAVVLALIVCLILSTIIFIALWLRHRSLTRHET